MIQSLPGATNLGNAPSNAESKKTKDAAQQFEALMIGQLLKLAHGDSESNEAGQQAVDYAEQQLAGTIAKNGGIGLTNFIVQGLHKAGSGPRV